MTDIRQILINSGGDIKLSGQRLTAPKAEKLAWDDGFDSIADFVKFFEVQYGLPFRGEMIEWVPVGKGQ